MSNYPGHIIRPGHFVVSQHTFGVIRDSKTTTTYVATIVPELQKRVPGCLPQVHSNFMVAKQKKAKWLPETFQDTHWRLVTLSLLTSPQKLINPLVIYFPGPRGIHMLHIGTWDSQVGCFFSQEQPVVWSQLIHYWSRSHNDVRPSYDTVLRGCLVAEWAGLLRRPYLQSIQFKICIAPHALSGILYISQASCRLVLWLHFSESILIIAHGTGIKHQAVDVPSAQQDITD